MEKIYEDDEIISYRTSCSCLDKDCQLDISIGYIDFGNNNGKLVMSIDTELFKFANKYGNKWYTGIWNRIKYAIKILFLGYIQVNGEFIFRNEEHVKEFVDNISSAIIKIKENEKEKNQS